MSARDHAHVEDFLPSPQVEHRYGPMVHLLADAVARSQLARLTEPGCTQPILNRMILNCYRSLVHAAAQDLFPRRTRVYRSRMADTTQAGNYVALGIDEATSVVLAAVARAGTLPAYYAMDVLCDFVEPDTVRVDHLFMNRRTDDDGQVVGVDFQGSKIGGDAHGAVLVVPDPMGATGTSMIHTVQHYKDTVEGTPRATACLHLIVTPEYLRNMRDAHPEVHVYALRLDRGLSSPDVLAEVPGQRWEEERGLNDVQYIVPGAGGLGEIMNNSFV